VSTGDLLDGVDVDAVIASMFGLMEDAFPLCRSITGPGVRETLALVGRTVPIHLHEVPTGAPALDWTVPREWKVREAWIKDPSGRKVVDFADHPLHLMGYSVGVRGEFTLEQLLPHLFSRPDMPDAIPYRTSYYNEAWGFCLRHRDLELLVKGRYEVLIDAELFDGSLTYGELVIPGSTDREVLLTTHICHPSMANDNLSGIAMLTALAELIQRSQRRHTYRLLFIPGTIGSLVWLERNRALLSKIDHGVVLTGLGDRGRPSWKRPRRSGTLVDRAFSHVLSAADRPDGATLVDYYPYGYDERQFCSPGFNLPVGRFSRSLHGEYPEYHSSADDLGFIVSESMLDSLSIIAEVLDILDGDCIPRSLAPFGEPQLGRRGLYSSVGGAIDQRSVEMALLWVMGYADGLCSLLDIATRSRMKFSTVVEAANRLSQAGLLDFAGDRS
jgi:aminopeptidase-like protein